MYLQKHISMCICTHPSICVTVSTKCTVGLSLRCFFSVGYFSFPLENPQGLQKNTLLIAPLCVYKAGRGFYFSNRSLLIPQVFSSPEDVLEVHVSKKQMGERATGLCCCHYVNGHLSLIMQPTHIHQYHHPGMASMFILFQT